MKSELSLNQYENSIKASRRYLRLQDKKIGGCKLEAMVFSSRLIQDETTRVRTAVWRQSSFSDMRELADS